MTGTAQHCVNAGEINIKDYVLVGDAKSGEGLIVKMTPGKYLCQADRIFYGNNPVNVDVRIIMDTYGSNLSKKEIGTIETDSCFAGFFEDKKDFDLEGWLDMQDFMIEGVYGGIKDIYHNDSFHGWSGFWTETGLSKGNAHPVYAIMDGDRMVGLELSYY